MLKAFAHLTLALALGVTVLPGYAETKASEYSISEKPSYGSLNLFRFTTVKASNVSLNKTWDELPENEKQMVRNYYVDLPADIEPPFPLEGLKPLHHAASKIHKKLLRAGVLEVTAVVDVDGTVKEVKVYSNYQADAAKVYSQMLLLTKFKPAKCQGKPCVMEYPVSWDFEVE